VGNGDHNAGDPSDGSLARIKVLSKINVEHTEAGQTEATESVV